MRVYLATERLLLRRFTGADADNRSDLDADPEVMRFVNGGTPTPREAIEHGYLPGWLDYYARGDRYGFWAAIERSSGAFLGWFHLRPLPGAPDDEPELGYRLRRAAWGRGYGTEGAPALIRKGFAEFGVRRVVASTAAANIGSRRVMEKAGMALVRTYRITFPDRFGGQEQEAVEYALSREEWARQEAGGPRSAAVPGRGGRPGSAG